MFLKQMKAIVYCSNFFSTVCGLSGIEICLKLCGAYMATKLRRGIITTESYVIYTLVIDTLVWQQCCYGTYIGLLDDTAF